MRGIQQAGPGTAAMAQPRSKPNERAPQASRQTPNKAGQQGCRAPPPNNPLPPYPLHAHLQLGQSMAELLAFVS